MSAVTSISYRAAVALAQLAAGGSADAVADALRAQGLKGSRMDECDCPIARLLLQLDGADRVAVCEGWAEIYPAGDGDPVGVRLPLMVDHFTRWFDEGLYLDLVDLSTGVGA